MNKWWTSPTANYLSNLTFGNNTFLTVGNYGTILTSSDNGTSLTQRTSGTSISFKDVTNKE
jgi:hypothetical protein